MALTVEQKSGLRRHLAYPTIGLSRTTTGGMTVGGASASWRFNQAFGFLEYRMNNLNPDEEARLTGSAVGSIALTGLQPNPGDSVSVVLTAAALGSPQTLTAITPALNGNDGLVTLTNALAAACSLNSVLQTAGFYAATPYGNGAFSQNSVALAEVAFSAPFAFTITASGTGLIAPQVTAQGALPSPFASLDGTTTVHGYLQIMDGLEAAFGGTSQNLDTSAAGPWKARANEIGQRAALYDHWQGKLSDFLGVPINPDKKTRRAPSSVRYL